MKPDFDRQGRQLKGIAYWVSFLFSLGGESFKGGLMRWVTVVVLAVIGKRFVDNRGGLPSYLR